MTTLSLITGNTYPHRQALRALGGRWNPIAQGWEVPAEIADRARARLPSFTARAILIAGLLNPVALRPIDDATVARFVERQPSATLAARCIRRAVTARPQTQTARTPRARPASPAPRSHTARPAES